MIDDDGVYLKVFNRHVALCVKDYVGMWKKQDDVVDAMRLAAVKGGTAQKHSREQRKYWGLKERWSAFESARDYIFGDRGLVVHAVCLGIEKKRVEAFRERVKVAAEKGCARGFKVGLL